MKKMTLIPSRNGIMYECFYCKERLTPSEADKHNACVYQIFNELDGDLWASGNA